MNTRELVEAFYFEVWNRADGNRAAARLRFTGRHRDEFLGFPPTGRQVTWAGTAFFTCEDARITDLWVLGDLAELRSQLRT